MTGMDRLTVSEAAARLGVSENALRKRVQRDTIEWDKDEDGRVYVYLSPTRTDQADGIAADQVADYATDQHAQVIKTLQAEVQFLREELRQARELREEEARRKDAIVMTMAQRIPELEPAQEPPESPESASGPEGSSPAPPDEEKRSWLKRFFGL